MTSQSILGKIYIPLKVEIMPGESTLTTGETADGQTFLSWELLTAFSKYPTSLNLLGATDLNQRFFSPSLMKNYHGPA